MPALFSTSRRTILSCSATSMSCNKGPICSSPYVCKSAVFRESPASMAKGLKPCRWARTEASGRLVTTKPIHSGNSRKRPLIKAAKGLVPSASAASSKASTRITSLCSRQMSPAIGSEMRNENKSCRLFFASSLRASSICSGEESA